jgi:hypothetical protein
MDHLTSSSVTASDAGTPARGDVHLLTEFCWGFLTAANMRSTVPLIIYTNGYQRFRNARKRTSCLMIRRRTLQLENGRCSYGELVAWHGDQQQHRGATQYEYWGK